MAEVIFTGKPFYIIKDTYNEYRITSASSLKDAKEKIIEWILKDYSSTSKRRETRTRTTKVWWVK